MSLFKKQFGIILLVMLSLLLVSCGKAEVYDACIYENLSTFSEITDVSAKEGVARGIYRTEYTYTLFEDSVERLTKYQEYLDKYGFTFDTDQSTETTFYFNKEGNYLALHIQEIGNGVELKVSYPNDEKTVETKEQKEYDRLLKIVEEEKYLLALNTTLKKDYKDTQKLLNYCNGMTKWEFQGAPASAIEYLKKAEGFKDAAQKIKEIEAIILPQNGTYYADNPKLPNRGIGYYIFIKDGKVATGFESNYKSKNFKNADPIYYLEELIKVSMTEEHIKGLSGEAKKMQVNPEDFFFCFGYVDDKLDRQYTFIDRPDGSKLVLPAYEGTYDTFAGNYKKVSDDVPPEK